MVFVRAWQLLVDVRLLIVVVRKDVKDSVPKAECFAPNQRLRSPHSFQAVFAANQRIYSRLFTLNYVGNGLPHGRVGIMISRRNAKRAIDRNRIKRITREHLRHHQAEWQGYDLVIIANKKTYTATNQELRACLQGLLAKLPMRSA